MIDEFDRVKLQELAERYGADNPVVQISEFICIIEPEESRNADFWERLGAWAEYCNQPVDVAAAHVQMGRSDIEKIFGLAPGILIQDDDEPTPQEE